MRWLLAFSMIVAIQGFGLYEVFQAGQFTWFHDLGTPGTKTERKIVTWDQTAIAHRPAWILKNTRLSRYVLFVADIIGAVGCVCQYHKRRDAWVWFRCFLFLIIVNQLASLCVILEHPQLGAELFVRWLVTPTSLASGFLLSLLLFELVQPSRVEPPDGIVDQPAG